ncbi:heparan sulfate 2-O-sulfotransferase pipe-like isoform X1 [Neodiprion virginianus]|uniref:heparan sulfate 2-O-sulfotransferase pipe-like isoform X1 n=2 Tax=Neodiprion virginianus TaxID=2961670 RepID=UPI001EE713A7|nr:heparan sulfate 2-O-sulfotransferase pipe-like isoform X1 [Neodiprion virginianus]XP_046621798.1 heparan sulfate 2-O-sulfotransferase pipe-like isoform X1 [Neodiprion virginianus]XP_046621799.1 heparan sulfate 2-O-sulfotransferase pipe-like isoform X1 [Neodiprion virginianus]
MITKDNTWRKRRLPIPKRTSELIALIALSSTLFLFLYTSDLHSRLREMEVRLQPGDEEGFFANQLSSEEPTSTDMDFESSGVVQYYSDINRKLTESYVNTNVPDIEALNNTRKADKAVIFFNRVPKVGSETFAELLRRLSTSNEFHFNRDLPQKYEFVFLAKQDEFELAKSIANIPEPSVFIKHVCFTNFTEFNLPEPIYMNLVRDPVERIISWYYYIRAPWYLLARRQMFPDLPLPDPQWLKKDFESCVLEGDMECQYIQGDIANGISDHRRQTLFFCGHQQECLPFNTVGVLERAKMTVEKNYAVVGILEDLNTTLTVLEKYIPRFFQGALNMYWDQVNSFSNINRNPLKPATSEKVKDILRRNFTKEIEFYQFCQQRLYKQFRALRLTN